MQLRPTRRTGAALSALALAVVVLGFSSSASIAGASPAWQVRLNAIRSMSLVKPVAYNSTWNTGCWNHSRYMSENGILTHYESSSQPYYTSSGAAAATRSNLAMASPYGALGTYGTKAIDMWAVGPFHALGMLNPKLRTVGWGLYRKSGHSDAAALNVQSGTIASTAVTYPVKWPGPGSTTPFLRYVGGEAPDPLSGTGYATPTGPPIIVRFNTAPRVTGTAFRCTTTGGTYLAHKWVTAATYTNANKSDQAVGRAILGYSVYIVPKNPLVSGRTYFMSITANGHRYSWSFKTGSAPRAATAH